VVELRAAAYGYVCGWIGLVDAVCYYLQHHRQVFNFTGYSVQSSTSWLTKGAASATSTAATKLKANKILVDDAPFTLQPNGVAA
jgi:hypothetical protein